MQSFFPGKDANNKFYYELSTEYITNDLCFGAHFCLFFVCLLLCNKQTKKAKIFVAQCTRGIISENAEAEE